MRLTNNQAIAVGVSGFFCGSLGFAQTLPNYEIHEMDYSAITGENPNAKWIAKVIDRQHNRLWICITSAAIDVQAPKVISLGCKNAMAGPSSTGQVPSLSQLVLAESIGPHSIQPRGVPEHFWFINPQTGAVTFCGEWQCLSVSYQ